jgi:pimeloyl-ACP methyl ester carboxylesterase
VAELSQRMPDAVRQDVPDVGHLIPIERPAAVVQACLALAGRVGSA